MPDHWDTKPENLFNPPAEQPDPASNGHEQTNKVRLKDDRGRLRLPAYVLIALGIAVAALLLMAVGLLVMDG